MKLSVMRRGGKENDVVSFTTMLSRGNPLTSTCFSIIESHLTVINSTLSGNIAQGGNSAGDGSGGSGYGGAIFNLDGTTILTYVTVANNNAIAGTSTALAGIALAGCHCCTGC